MSAVQNEQVDAVTEYASDEEMVSDRIADLVEYLVVSIVDDVDSVTDGIGLHVVVVALDVPAWSSHSVSADRILKDAARSRRLGDVDQSEVLGDFTQHDNGQEFELIDGGIIHHLQSLERSASFGDDIVDQSISVVEFDQIHHIHLDGLAQPGTGDRLTYPVARFYLLQEFERTRTGYVGRVGSWVVGTRL